MRMIFFSLILLSVVNEISTASSLNVFFGDSFRQTFVQQSNSSDVCMALSEITQDIKAKFAVIIERIAELERKLQDLLRTMSFPKPKISNVVCHNGYDYYVQEDFCYKFHSDCGTWDEARRSCKQEGGDLISLTEVNFIYFKDLSQSKAGNCGNVWVGTSDASLEGQWFWLNGVKVANVFWAANQPDNWGNKENCGELSKLADYQLNDDSCDTKYHYICSVVCPTGYDYYPQENFCYKFHSDCGTWDEARTSCQQEGGDLISLTEVNFMYFKDLSRSKAGNCGNVWVGTTDASVEGQWFWLNGVKVADVFWAADQPDNWSQMENCADLSKLFGYQMNDENCNTKQHYICRIG